ncbi:Rv3654c family TadE-like protein [Actinocrispum sp. NPDC049592]|uniref:Rv3654c family TadE-like protein n=1 Tax=Actinocrispum sp. NPDC049592 TaxID=3154835 RepID=UPI003445304E
MRPGDVEPSCVRLGVLGSDESWPGFRLDCMRADDVERGCVRLGALGSDDVEPGRVRLGVYGANDSWPSCVLPDALESDRTWLSDPFGSGGSPSDAGRLGGLRSGELASAALEAGRPGFGGTGLDQGGGDRGVATVWTAWVVAGIAALVGAIVGVGMVASVRHRAESAADLGALAAASYGPWGEEYACGLARWVAEGMGVRLTSCRMEGWEAWVEVAGAVSGLGTVTARARAGPVDDWTRAGETPVRPRATVVHKR